ncbi:MAG TPA: hypothetical protein VGE84_05225 [Allosphingosinicella sp.]
MPALQQQLLACFAGDRVLSRDQLRLDASYDSVGRALSELVREGKLARVGRGRYRRRKDKEPSSPASVIAKVERRIGRSKRNVFLRKDFDDVATYDVVGRVLRKLTERGRLVQIGYGLYARAEQSPLTGKPAPVVGIGRLASEALSRLGKPVEEASFTRDYGSGRSTQVPTGRTIAVKGRVRRRIGYDGKYVAFERAR